MITVNKEEKRIDISEPFTEVLLIVDGTEYKVPLEGYVGFIANIDSEMNEIKAYGMVELTVG